MTTDLARLRRRAFAPGIALLALALSAGTLRNDLAYDNMALVVDNAAITDAAHVPQILAGALWTGTGQKSSYDRPLPPLLVTVLSLAVASDSWRLLEPPRVLAAQDLQQPRSPAPPGGRLEQAPVAREGSTFGCPTATVCQQRGVDH